MNLIEESFENAPKPDNSKKIAKILLIVIAILVIITVGLFIMLNYIKANTLVVTLDGKTNEKIKDMLIFEENGTVYIPIKKIAPYLGYDSFNGDYINKSEEPNKCYVQEKSSESEIANFSLNSDKIYKITMGEEQGENYSYYNIDKVVQSKNGELCTTIDGIEKAFNVSFNYDIDNKRIKIYTMPYLISSYEKKVLDLGYTEMATKNFNDRKTILNNMIIVKKGKDQNQKYGVIDISKNGESVLETKYTNITYIPNTGDFLVEDGEKMGILSSTGERRIKIDYDSIKILDSNEKLYVVEKNKKYGVVDINGKTVVNLDYDDIGVDSDKFPKNDIKNRYLIADNLIPLKKGKLWGFADKNGKIVVDFKFDSLGYIASSNKGVDNLLVIPDYNVVVACKDKKYLLINSLGKLLWNGATFDDIYMEASSTEKKYYLSRNDKIYDAEEQLDKINPKSNKTSNNQTSTDDDENTNTNANINVNNTSNTNTNTNKTNTSKSNNKT